MKPEKKSIVFLLGGLCIGIVNGLFGAGGGMLAVPLLVYAGCDQNSAHANSIAVIFPLSVVSAVLYLLRGNADLGAVWPLLPFGLAGALLGTFLLKKLNPKWLRRIFALFMLWAGIRMFL